jgi:hypothetical protein
LRTVVSSITGEGSFKLTKKLLQQQNNSFKCFVQILVHSANKKMDDLTRLFQDQKNSLQFSQDQLIELKQENGKMT